MPTKWLQQRANGSKNEPGIGFEGPGVGQCAVGHESSATFTVKSREGGCCEARVGHFTPLGRVRRSPAHSNFERNVTNFAPHEALKLIAWGRLTFEERVVVHPTLRGRVRRPPAHSYLTQCIDQ